jgi:hypothetical protein
VIDLALPSVRDLEALPDGTTVEIAEVLRPFIVRVWTARPARVPWLRFWEHRLVNGDTILATSSILAVQIMGLVIDYGEVAVPVVTLPELAGLSCSDCAVPYLRFGGRWVCPTCRGYVTDADVAHLRRGGGA